MLRQCHRPTNCLRLEGFESTHCCYCHSYVNRTDHNVTVKLHISVKDEINREGVQLTPNVDDILMIRHSHTIDVAGTL
jgi:hypothetical protein